MLFKKESYFLKCSILDYSSNILHFSSKCKTNLQTYKQRLGHLFSLTLNVSKKKFNQEDCSTFI